MSVKASVSITEQQNQFVRDLVAKGRYSSISAVVQQGIEMLKTETEIKNAELNAFRAFIEERAAGPFVPIVKDDPWIRNIISASLSSHDLED